MKTETATHMQIASILDDGWALVADTLTSKNPLDFPGYTPPSEESVVCASGKINGLPIEMIVFDFGALGGTMGVVAGERIARAFERAIERRAAVVALLASGGARMQEGMVALVQMAKTVVARQQHARVGLPFIAWLSDPTAGGAYASFAGLADVIWAEPRATVGFAGPRVVETFTGQPLPNGSHTAESSLRQGLVDDLVARPDLRARIARVLDLLLGDDSPASRDKPSFHGDAASGDEWSEVQLARHKDRPTGRDFAHRLASEIEQIRGDRAGTSQTGCLTGIARIAGRRVGLIAHERRPLPAAAFRQSQRLIRMVARFGLPVVTLVDTPGADPSSTQEAGGVARAISGTFRDVLEHPYATACVVTGEGGSGGALAFACTDRLYAMQHSIFSVIGPEGAAAILKRPDPADVARDLKLTAADLQSLGISDGTVAEPDPGAHAHPDLATLAVESAVAHALAELGDRDVKTARLDRWRQAGNAYLEER